MDQAKLDELLALPAAEKLRLIEDLWASLPCDVPLTAEQEQELDRRLALYKQDPDAGRSWEEIRDS